MLQVTKNGFGPRISIVWLSGRRSGSCSGSGSTRPSMIAASWPAAASRMAANHSREARQSSSVRAISGAFAARHPVLREAAGPRGASCLSTRTSSPSALVAACAMASASADPSSTITTSKLSRSSVCSASERIRVASDRGRSWVGTTTLISGAMGAASVSGARARESPSPRRWFAARGKR